jgi:hypothetical protein
MPDACPPIEALERMLADRLDGPEAEGVERHVAGCAACQRALEALTDEPDRTVDMPGDGPPSGGRTFLDRLASEAPTWLAGEEPPPSNGAGSPPTDTAPAVRTGPSVPRRPTIPGYQVLDELGHGGMGVVYRARQLGANRLVALKVIRAAESSRPEDLLRFLIEGETLARLRHPNIVQVYEVGTHDGQPFLALEYVDGGTLAEVAAASPMPARAAAALVETLARAVHAAHQCGIVHRDLKPANILLAREKEGSGSSGVGDPAGVGTPKVADFGLAKPVAGGSGLTRTGQVLGTPSYMAPEQATAAANVGVPADVHALGAILYELLAGRPAFRADSPWETMMQVVHQAPAPPSRWRPGLPRDLEVIGLKCLEKDPARRYPSADALADDLRRWLAGEPVRARPAGAARRAWMWCRRRPALAALAGGLAAALIVGVAGIAVQWRRAEANLAEASVQRRRAEASLADASARLALAMGAIEGYYTGISQDVLLKQPELADLRRSLLRQPLEFYRRLRADLEARGRGDPAIRAQLARAIRDLARLTAEVGTAGDAAAA